MNSSVQSQSVYVLIKPAALPSGRIVRIYWCIMNLVVLMSRNMTLICLNLTSTVLTVIIKEPLCTAF